MGSRHSQLLLLSWPDLPRPFLLRVTCTIFVSLPPGGHIRRKRNCCSLSVGICVFNNMEPFVTNVTFAFQDFQLVNFGHLIKDGELLVKVSDQPPKKRYEKL